MQVTSSGQKNLAENLTMFEENDNKGAAVALTENAEDVEDDEAIDIQLEKVSEVTYDSVNSGQKPPQLSIK